MYSSIFLKERACPNCEYGKVQTYELPSGAECSYCHKLIEVEFKSKMVIACGSMFLIFFLVYLQFIVFAFIVLVLFGIYNALLHQITSCYLPLKFYDDT